MKFEFFSILTFPMQMQKASDQSKMDQISSFLERIDDDQDGHLKVDDVLKVYMPAIKFSQTNFDSSIEFAISDF